MKKPLAQNLNQPYNETTFLTTHNSFSNKKDGWTYYQQSKSVAEQLDAGIRAFMVDPWYVSLYPWGPKKVYLLHGNVGRRTTWIFQLFKYRTLENFLSEIIAFLDAPGNENEIITVFIDSGNNDTVKTPVGISAVKDALSNFRKFLFNPAIGKGFASTLAEITATKEKRLIIFSDFRGNRNTHSVQPRDGFDLPLVWHYARESVYGDKSLNSSTWANLRAESADSKSTDMSLDLLNHFPDLVSRIPLNYTQKVTRFFTEKNSFTLLADHVIDYKMKHDQVPNFVAVDMFELGKNNGPQEILEYCDQLRKFNKVTVKICGVNRQYLTADGGIVQRSAISCKASTSPLEFTLTGSLDYCLLSTEDAKGNTFYLSYTSSNGALELFNTPEAAHFKFELVGNMTYKVECVDLPGRYISLYGVDPYLSKGGATAAGNYWTLTIDNTVSQLSKVQISSADSKVPQGLLYAQKEIVKQSKIYCIPSGPSNLLTFEVLGPYEECVFRVEGLKDALFLSWSENMWAELWDEPIKFRLTLVPGTLDIYNVHYIDIDRYLRVSFRSGDMHLQAFASHPVGSISGDDMKWRVQLI